MSIASIALALTFALGSPGEAGGKDADSPSPAAPGQLLRLEEGDWLVYKGALKVRKHREGEDPEDLSASIEAAYLGLGAPEKVPGADPGVRRALLLRDCEAPEDGSVAFQEAVSLIAGPDLAVRPEIPAEDRAAVSKVLFTYLPLGIFPPLSSAEPRRWKGPSLLQFLFSEPRELLAAHRIEPAPAPAPAGSLRYAVEADPGQRVSFTRDRLEIPLAVEGLRQIYTLGPEAKGLWSYESRLEGKLLEPGGAAAIRVEIELTRVESQRVGGERWTGLRAEAELLRDIERTLFVALDPDAAQSKAAAFERDRRGSRLARFAAGLARQADDVWPIANERRLYGKPAPDFTLTDLDGQEATLSTLLPGKVTWLVFWSVG